MSELYIDWELSLECNPYNTMPNLHALVDKGVVRHLICNITPPDGYTHEDLYTDPVMNRILEEFDKMPVWTFSDILKGVAKSESDETINKYCAHDAAIVMHFYQSGEGNSAAGYVEHMETHADHIRNPGPATITIGEIGNSETRRGTGGDP